MIFFNRWFSKLRKLNWLRTESKPVGGSEFSVGDLPIRKKAWKRAEQNKTEWWTWWTSLSFEKKMSEQMKYHYGDLIKEHVAKQSAFTELAKSGMSWNGGCLIVPINNSRKRKRSMYRRKY